MRAVDLFVPPFVVVQKNRFGLFSLFFPRTDLACVCCSPPFSSSSSVCHSLLVNGLMNFPPLVDSANARRAFTRKAWGDTNTQADKQTDKQADRQTRHAHTHTHTHTLTHTHRQTDTGTHKDTHKDTHIHTHTHKDVYSAVSLFKVRTERHKRQAREQTERCQKSTKETKQSSILSFFSFAHFPAAISPCIALLERGINHPHPLYQVKTKQPNQTKTKHNKPTTATTAATNQITTISAITDSSLPPPP